MKLSLNQTKHLLMGEHPFSQLGFSMMLTRLKGVYRANPNQDVLEKSMNEINVFLEKFKTIMKKDITILTQIGGN
jgi:hypothetical protein